MPYYRCDDCKKVMKVKQFQLKHRPFFCRYCNSPFLHKEVK